jgi:hypothetical protein
VRCQVHPLRALASRESLVARGVFAAEDAHVHPALFENALHLANFHVYIYEHKDHFTGGKKRVCELIAQQIA